MKIKKIILTTLLIVPMAITPLQPTYAAFISSSPQPTESYNDTVSPQSDVLIWQYKKENGKVYKRLYNSTTRTWVGDWIYVRDC